MKCEICGQTAVTTHEIISRGSLRDEKIWSVPENQLDLCTGCHNSIHKGIQTTIDRLRKTADKIEGAKQIVRNLEKIKNGRE